jgi:ribulose-5-phosphate 4-epimerase/fuculose-1-phosphate aldolase
LEKRHLTPLESALQDLVDGNHILAHHRVVDVFGHLSVRHPERPDRYFMSASCAPGSVTRADLVEFTLDSEPIDQAGRRLYAERPIHGRIYASRPDVMSVCHNHSPATIPFGVTNEPLRPILHVGSVIGKNVPVWDISDDFGDTDLLVVTADMGTSLAKTLGQGPVVLMRGHGASVAGGGVREVVFICVYLQMNAEISLAARSLGSTIRYLSDGEIERASPYASLPLSQDRAWNGWLNEMERSPVSR